MNNITLRITGMTCEHCARTVEKALSNLPVVVSASVSYDDGLASVAAQSEINTDTLVRAVKASGYTAEIIGSDNAAAGKEIKTKLHIAVIGDQARAIECKGEGGGSCGSHTVPWRWTVPPRERNDRKSRPTCISLRPLLTTTHARDLRA